MMDLSNKTGLITGATTGIGFESAKRALEIGAKSVFITGQSQERLEKAEKELSSYGSVHGLLWRGEELADSPQLAESIKKVSGKLDFAFLNAGVCWASPIGSLDPVEVQKQLTINFSAPLVLTSEVIPLFLDGGSIVLTTSCLNQLGIPGYAAYSASKAGLRSLARTLSAELLEKSIRVNSIAPGPIETPIHMKYGLEGKELEAVKEHVASMVPLRRFGTTEEIVEAVMFLISDSSSYMLGEEITIDGGWSNL